MRPHQLREWVAALWRYRVALCLALVHAIVFVALIFSKPPLPPPSSLPCPEFCLDPWYSSEGWVVAGRYFHSELALLGALVDLPALVATFVLGELIVLLMKGVDIRLSIEAQSYLLAWLWLGFGTTQWWLCGVVFKERPSMPLQPASDPANLE